MLTVRRIAAMAVIVGCTLIGCALSSKVPGRGTIEITLNWPGTLQPPIDAVEVTVNGDAVPGATVSFDPGGSMLNYLESKPAGSYVLCIELLSGATLRAIVTEPVQVSWNLTSSVTIVLTTDDFTSAPEPPGSLAVTEGLAQLELRWVDASDVETGYVVERDTAEAGPFAILDGSLPANTEHDVDASVSAGTTYWYRVKATNAVGDSAYAGPVSGKMEAPTPGGGGVLTYSDATTSAIRVSWQKATDNASAEAALEYRVVRSLLDNIQTVADAESNGTLVMGWTADTTTVVAAGLSAGTQYWFNVLVRDAAGNPSASLSSSTATSTVGVTRIIDHTNFDPASVPDMNIAHAAVLDVYFEHASVGKNVIDGLAALEVQAARYLFGVAGHHVSWSSSNDPSWYLAHDGLGDNDRGNPGAFAKVSDFSSRMTAALAAAIDVATFKFCYIDTPSDGADFFTNTVQPAMESLQATYPDVVFVWWTMPIQTTSELQRQIYNDAARAYCYANRQWLLDIADLESHDQTGAACFDGNGREILYNGYTTDGGHLNSTGSLKVAKAYWRLLSEIVKIP